MGDDFLKQLSEKYPFISVVSYGKEEFVGIIQNQDTHVTTLYNYGKIVDPLLKKKFLELAEVWWWESNRQIPINIFLKDEWSPFTKYLMHMVNKDLDIIMGPVVSLKEIAQKRTKRRSITLVKRINSD